MKNNPGIFLGLIITLVALIFFAAVKGRKKGQTPTTLPRPPIERSMWKPSSESPSSAPRSHSVHNSHFPENSSLPGDADLANNTPENQLTPAQSVPSSSSHLRLEIVESPNYVGPQQLTITQFPFTIGRSYCDLSLKDTQISRQHLRILVEDGQLFIMDMDSTNGTIVDGEPLTAWKKYPLERTGQTLRMGHHTIIKLGSGYF
jgi:hypothetical protein